MSIKQSKICKQCNTIFYRNKKCSNIQWDKRIYCSLVCSRISQKGKKRKSWGKHTEETKRKMSIFNPNRNNFTSNSYHAIHLWLRKQVQKSKCDFCSSTRFMEWALKKGCKHEHNINNYFSLCSSCHKKYDYTEERRKKLSNSLKGRTIYWKDKISQSNLGKEMSIEAKEKMSLFHKEQYKLRIRNKYGQFT